MHRDVGAKIPSQPCASPVFYLENYISLFRQPVMEHILSIIVAPAAIDVLQIPGSMNEHDERIFSRRREIRRLVDHCRNGFPVPALEMNDLRDHPFDCLELSRNR